MPWKSSTMFEEKQSFIREYLSGNYTMKNLCEEFGISRTTGYRLVRRYELLGDSGLESDSRAPHHHPNRTPRHIEDSVIRLRKRHPTWGAKKFRELLSFEYPGTDLPSRMTIHNILRRNGLVKAKKRFRRVRPVHPIYDSKSSNEVWSADFKGKFRMGNGRYCHPLTVVDKYSRYILTAKGMYSENFRDVRREFERLFREYGMPLQIHTDNGIPFGSVRSVRRYGRLSYWFLELGIEPVFSDPGSPQQNGKHERMHRDLKDSCAKPACKDLRSQQRKLNGFVGEYNDLRPHEALGMRTPSGIYEKSDREYPGRIRDYEYPEGVYGRRITKSGGIRWGKRGLVYVSSALAGKEVGIEESGNGIWRVYYREVLLGYFDTNKLDKAKPSLSLYYD